MNQVRGFSSPHPEKQFHLTPTPLLGGEGRKLAYPLVLSLGNTISTDGNTFGSQPAYDLR